MSKYKNRNAGKLIKDVMVKELVRHKDERGFFEELIRKSDGFFKEGFGQLSHSFMYPGIIKAWHIHQKQIDWWYVSRGNLQVALCDLRKDSPTYKKINQFLLGEQNDNIVLKIPAGVAHGCKADKQEAELFYVTSSTYDPKEEGRIPHNDSQIGFDWLKFQELK